MAVQREARDIDFGNAPSAGAAPSNVATKQPNVNKFLSGPARGPAPDTTLDNVLEAIVPAVKKLGQQEIDAARQEAYLKGQAAAAAGEAQDAVDSNIFTKDWATAGWADTRGRMALADAEAQTSIDMTTLREKSPQEAQVYLNERRRKLAPYLEGMSLEARKGFMAQQLTSDRAFIGKQAMEHQKFVIDTIGKSVTTGMTVQYDALDKARTDPVTYTTQTDNAFAALYGNVWTNKNLPLDNKIKLTTDAAAAALSRNHAMLYERMRDEKMDDGMTMLQRLPFDDQVKLQKAYEGSLKDTAAMRLGNYQTQLGLMLSSFDDPTAPAMSYKDFQAFIDNGVQLKAITPEQIASYTKQWADSNRKKTAEAGLAQAYAAGDVQGIYARGKDEGQALDAYVQANVRAGTPINQLVGNLLQIGNTTRQQSAFKKVGELTRSAVSTIGQGDSIDPAQLQMLNTVFDTIDIAQKGGNTGAMSSYLSAFDEDERSKLLMYREGRQKGKAPEVAAADAAALYAQQSSMTNAEKGAAAINHDKANTAMVAEIEPRGLLSTIWSYNPFRGSDRRNLDAINTGRAWFENEERVNEAVASSKVALQEELRYLSRSNPLMSDDARRSSALASVAERAIATEGGPLILPRLPRGTTAQDFFGVPRSVSKETIGQTLNELHTPAKGNRVVYKMTGNAQVQWQEYGPDGQLMNPGGVFNPKDVSRAIREKQDKLSDEFNRTDGRGITMKGTDGKSEVTFNGDNTAGAPNATMLEFRQQLVKHEDVRSSPYEDASGKVVDGKRVTTVGAGVSSHNPFYPKAEADGTIKQEAINDSFMRASNAAAKTGRTVQREADLANTPAFKLFSEMAYQGGSVAKSFVSAMRSRDVDKAVEALKDTPQYKMAHDARKQSYEKLVRDSLKLARS